MIIRSMPVRPTVYHWCLGIAVCAILVSLAANPIRDRRERFLSIADVYARSGAEYLRNANGDATMKRIGAWHLFLGLEYERAADHPWTTPPTILMFPPRGWKPPAEAKASTSGFGSPE